VPTHRLGEDVADIFRALGLTAKVFRGRTADDPSFPGNMDRPQEDRVKMCTELERVELAQQCGKSIKESCCRQGESKCPSFEVCHYQRQFREEKPNIWLAAHDMAFYEQTEFGSIAGIIIDESFFTTGLSEGHPIELDTIAAPLSDADYKVKRSQKKRSPRAEFFDEATERRILLNQVHERRAHLVKMLRTQTKDGGVERARIESFSPDACTEALRAEWNIVNSLVLTPSMSNEELRAAKQRAQAVGLARRMVGVWGALRELLERLEITVSGRLILDKVQDKEGKQKRVLRRCGVRPISESRQQLPVLIMDATLPDVAILQKFFPQVEVVAEIEAAMPPSVRVRQVLSAPTSQRRLWGTAKRPSGDHNLKAVRRYIVQRWIETGRKPMLVVCQHKVEQWLKATELPDGIAIEHFNAISGLDQYRDVRTLVLIGRTLPGPLAVEANAGAVTGTEPTKEIGPWYSKVTRGIRLADGSGVAVECDEHCDPLSEALRWQICEGELIQALGRARGVNRDADHPLDIDILADVVLPVTVDEVAPWQAPNPIVEMLASGLALIGSPADMLKAWPRAWPSLTTANRSLKSFIAKWHSNPPSGEDPQQHEEGISVPKCYRRESLNSILALKSWLPLTYLRRAGRGVKHTAALHDPAVAPVPREQMEERLGRLAALHHVVERLHSAPLAGAGYLQVETTLRPGDLLNRLFDLSARRRERRKALYSAKATPEHHASGPPGRYAAVQPTTAWSGDARGTKPAEPKKKIGFPGGRLLPGGARSYCPVCAQPPEPFICEAIDRGEDEPQAA
jgi:putative DNA primase/helicase